MKIWRIVALLIGMSLFAVALMVPMPGLVLEARLALAIFAIAAWFWVSEPIPIYATSLMVIFMQVLLLSKEGVMRFMAPTYAPPAYDHFMATLSHPIIILFLGGFVLARGAVKYQLDRTLIRVFLKPFGSKPNSVLAGLIVLTSAIGAFMSNTATTAMMMTVILPLVAQMESGDRFRIALALAIPFAANIGGLITPIASPPNAVVLAAIGNYGVEISFTEWIGLMFPLVAVTLTILWYLLCKMYPTQAQFNVEIEKESNPSKKRFSMYFVFGLTVLLWMTEAIHKVPSALVALVPVVLMTASGLIDRDDIRGLSWEVLWLVAGGIALGVSLRDTGLAEWVVTSIPMGGVGAFGILVMIIVVGGLISNFLSNTVTASMLIPIAISLVTGGALQDVPSLEILALTVACASGLGITLPISTPPNAIAIASGLVSPREMMKTGILIGVIQGMLLIVVARYYWPFILGLAD